jgi:peptidyl-dipeptidase A
MVRWILGALMMSLPISSGFADPDTTSKAKAFIEAHEKRIRPLDIKAGKAWWDANTTGKDEDFKKKEEIQNELDTALANPSTFAELKELKKAKDAGKIDQPVLARAIEVLYLLYLEKQVEPELLRKITAKANAVEQKFNVFRAKVGGNDLSDSQVRKVLKESRDSQERKAVWEASKKVGLNVEADLKELVKLRNEAAKQLGFKNYQAMMLNLNEQESDDVIKLFDELDNLTRVPFARAKGEIDELLAKRSGVKVPELMPWHYDDPFFQESPAVFDVDLDAPFQKADILKLCERFYDGIGLPIGGVITRSDLFEKKGKSQHAFCTDIDREGDVRVLANIVPTEYWMSTMLHELGHAVYSSLNIPQSVPYALRGESHILTTEGVAMQFQKFSKQRAWLEKMGVTVPNGEMFDVVAAKVLRNELLIFSRWCQVMLRFEKGMYENPDQDLNELWWSLVEKYQMMQRPANRNSPDYGSKIHICSAPVYYHNYMMGQLFASQVHHALCKEVFQSNDPNSVQYVGEKKVGDFMKKKVFEPGRTLNWNELTKFATGENLSAKAFAKDFSGK